MWICSFWDLINWASHVCVATAPNLCRVWDILAWCFHVFLHSLCIFRDTTLQVYRHKLHAICSLSFAITLPFRRLLNQGRCFDSQVSQHYVGHFTLHSLRSYMPPSSSGLDCKVSVTQYSKTTVTLFSLTLRLPNSISSVIRVTLVAGKVFTQYCDIGKLFALIQCWNIVQQIERVGFQRCQT
jgi:hypothetical protein